MLNNGVQRLDLIFIRVRKKQVPLFQDELFFPVIKLPFLVVLFQDLNKLLTVDVFEEILSIELLHRLEKG